MSARRELPSTADIVLGVAQRPARRGALIAGLAAGVLHIGAAAVAVALGAPTERPPKRESQPLVVFDHVVELEPPTAKAPPPAEPAPEPAAKEPPRPKLKQPKAAATPTPKPSAPPEAPEPELPPSEPPPAAQAGQVVAAAEATPAAFSVASGRGQGYAGGTTTAQGTGTHANHTGQVGDGDGNGLGRAKPPQLRSRDWPCGWPPEAEDLELDEAFVTVRVSVASDGALSNVEVLSDPGHGFGRRAVWCARSKVRFDPARDAEGRPVAGTTPPVRIRFVREE